MLALTRACEAGDDACFSPPRFLRTTVGRDAKPHCCASLGSRSRRETRDSLSPNYTTTDGAASRDRKHSRSLAEFLDARRRVNGVFINPERTRTYITRTRACDAYERREQHYARLALAFAFDDCLPVEESLLSGALNKGRSPLHLFPSSASIS